MKRCEYMVSEEQFCGCPGRRVSEGRHYCREHFDAVLEPAKGEVVKYADKLRSYVVSQAISKDWENEALRHLCVALDALEKLGYEPGD